MSTIVLCLYFICYVVTLRIGVYVMFCSHHPIYILTCFQDTILSADSVEGVSFTAWSQLNLLRSACAILAWLGYFTVFFVSALDHGIFVRNCQMVLNDLYQRLLNDQGLLLLRDSCLHWKNRFESMCGDGDKIASMGEADLQLLLKQQQRGAERTAVALKELQRNTKQE